ADAARAYLSGYVPGVIREVEMDPRAARSVATTTLGKEVVDGIRSQTASLESLISNRQARRQLAAHRSANQAVTVAVIVLIALTALTVALCGLLGRLLLGRERARERASFLADAGAQIDRAANTRQVLDTFAELAVARGADLVMAAELPSASGQIPAVEPARATRGEEAIIPDDAWSDLDAAWDRALRAAQTHLATTAAVATLAVQGTQVHVISVASIARGSLVARVLVARRRRPWRRDDVQELTDLTVRLGLALQARALQARTEALYRTSEQTALTLQHSLLPADLPTIPDCELAIRFAPAGEGELVGGDFYDVFGVGSDRWAVVIGDVCGKGAPAAAVTAMARWTLRSLAGTARPPAEALRALNDAMLRQNVDGRFITVLYALVHVGDGEAHVSLASAGHPPAVVVSPAGTPVGVESTGELLGVWRDVRLDQVELDLRPGESLVLYTDGVTDQGPGAELSAEGAIRGLTAEPTADRLAEALSHEAMRWEGAQRDIMAIVVLRYLPGEDAEPGESRGDPRPDERGDPAPRGQSASRRLTSDPPSRAIRERGMTRSKPAASACARTSASTCE
ncbi:MAG: serine/threonine-protein phosphatase, partial [Solirubrobacterales bacterium]|nr:serine/threonine-protein phosphatase [Solirubrobacterales bacterium]